MARPRRSESGFALLLVFLMAAIVAIALYTEIPRVAFQSQRAKEQMLMERGEQYKLGIRRFMQVNSRLPANLDELEKLNNRHFLRRRYKDPMTGKDEWRLIHSTGGVLTDSKLGKKGDKKETNPNAGTFVADMPGLGSMPVNGQGANLATRRRASEGGGADFSQIGGATSPSTGAPDNPAVPGSPGAGYPGMPGAPTNPQPGGASAPAGGGFVGGGGSFVGGGSGVGSQPNNPAGGAPVYPGQTPGAPGMPGAPGATGLGFPGSAPGQPNQAVNMINNILTSPRPGGLAGIQAGAAGMGGTGIAGVASSVDEDAIMVYADQTNYSLWEFVYDGKFQPPPDPRQGNGGTPAGQIGNMAGSSPPGSPIGSPIGSPAGSPAGSSFGGSQPGSSFGGGQAITSFGQSSPSAQPGQTGQPTQGGMTLGGGQPGGPNAGSTNLNLRPGRR
ncbi:MAG: type II secretion system protein [Candidatus Sulfopaludibacter sp.]|nr:type II secretion system protein [Candidatus Sulfopaludibacter sp.]